MASVLKYLRNYKTWRYRLISELGDTLLEVNPVGWDKKQLTLTRNQTYFAIFRSFSASLEYVRNGYDILKQLEDTDGILAECTLAVDKRNTTTLQDTNVFTAKVDFSKFIESTKNKKGISVPLVDNSFLEKLKTRENIDIPFDRPESLDGDVINEGVYTDISLLGREYISAAIGEQYIDDPENLGLNKYESSNEGVTYFTIRYNFASVDLFPNFHNIPKLEKIGFPLTFYKTDCFYYQELSTAVVNVNTIFKGYTSSNAFVFLYKDKFDEIGNPLPFPNVPEKIREYDFSPLGDPANFDESETDSITVNQDEGLYIYIVIPFYVNHVLFDEATKINVDVISEFEPTPCKVVLPFEAFDYMATATTGEANSFRSNVFGRTDIGYAEDGEYAFISLTKGLLIRQFDTGYLQLDGEDKKAQLSFKFKELFEAYYKLKNIAIEVIEEDGKNIIVAEKKIDLFSDEVSLTLDSIDKGSLERERLTEMFISDIDVGYKVPENDLQSGLEEYNNKETYSSIITNNQNKLDLVNPYTASGIQIEKERRNPRLVSATEEIAYDNTIFFIELCRDQHGQIVQRTTEGFGEINGITGVPTKINLGLTPKQSLLAHGWEINAGLVKFPTSEVKYNTSDKTTDLSFKYDGSDVLIVENESILAGNLDNPKFTGFLINFSAPLSFELFIFLRNNQNKLVKVWSELSDEYIYGWIKEVSTEPVDKPTNWQLIEANPPDIATLKVLATDKGEVIEIIQDIVVENEVVQIV